MNILPLSQKKIVFIIFLLIILFAIFMALMTSQANPNPQNQTPSLPPSEKTPLSIINNSLRGEYVGWTEILEITFDQPIAINQVEISILPETQYRAYTNSTGNILMIDPQDSWIFDKDYKVIIGKNTKSARGGSLGQDYEIIFKTYPFSGI